MDAYEAMPHAPDDPTVKAAYQAMIDETVAQYAGMLATGPIFWLMGVMMDAIFRQEKSPSESITWAYSWRKRRDSNPR